MPEVESVIENKTGFYFEENKVESLSAAIENLWGIRTINGGGLH